jgi:hypothetical protein
MFHVKHFGAIGGEKAGMASYAGRIGLSGIARKKCKFGHYSPRIITQAAMAWVYVSPCVLTEPSRSSRPYAALDNRQGRDAVLEMPRCPQQAQN